MKTAVYAIRPLDALVTDGDGASFWLRDVPKHPEELRVRAMVASGDYFETLAVRLEQVAAALPIKSLEQYQLQDAVAQLIYLQRHYAITKKV